MTTDEELWKETVGSLDQDQIGVYMGGIIGGLGELLDVLMEHIEELPEPVRLKVAKMGRMILGPFA